MTRDPLTGTALPSAHLNKDKAVTVRGGSRMRPTSAMVPHARWPADELNFRVLAALFTAGTLGLTASEMAERFPAVDLKRIWRALSIVRARKFAVAAGKGRGTVTRITEAGMAAIEAHGDAGRLGALPDASTFNPQKEDHHERSREI